MASSYPGGLDALPTNHQDGINETIHASFINDLNDAVNKIEAELGVNPKGTQATVVARLNLLERPSVVTPGSAPYTLALADASKLIEMNFGSANVLQVPTDAAVAFPVGTGFQIVQYGAGQTSIAAVTPGTTSIRSRGGALKMAGQYAAATLWKRAADEWILSGDITT